MEIAWLDYSLLIFQKASTCQLSDPVLKFPLFLNVPKIDRSIAVPTLLDAER